MNKNYMELLNEKFPNQFKWSEPVSTGPPHLPTFTIRLDLKDESFQGFGSRIKEAKHNAAEKAVKSFTRKPLLVDQDILDKISTALKFKYNEVFNNFNKPKNWSVLSLIVLTDEFNVDFVDVICMTTGTKCIKSENISTDGSTVIVSHAEVLARRSFNLYIYQQICRLITNNYNNKGLIVEKLGDGKSFRLKPNIKIHLYISSAPCGDARIFSHDGQQGDPHANRQKRGLLRAKFTDGEGLIHLGKPELINQNLKDIKENKERFMIMSCSDKIAIWSVVGIQGSLLSYFMEPIYLSSVILSENFNYEHLYRALNGRLIDNFDKNSKMNLLSSYSLNKCSFGKIQLEQEMSYDKVKSGGNQRYSLIWVKGFEEPEVLSCHSGRTHIDGKDSQICKKEMFKLFKHIYDKMFPSPIIYYNMAKYASLDYKKAKEQCKNIFVRNNLGYWCMVPQDVDNFRLF